MIGEIPWREFFFKSVQYEILELKSQEIVLIHEYSRYALQKYKKSSLVGSYEFNA